MANRLLQFVLFSVLFFLHGSQNCCTCAGKCKAGSHGCAGFGRTALFVLPGRLLGGGLTLELYDGVTNYIALIAVDQLNGDGVAVYGDHLVVLALGHARELPILEVAVAGVGKADLGGIGGIYLIVHIVADLTVYLADLVIVSGGVLL